MNVVEVAGITVSLLEKLVDDENEAVRCSVAYNRITPANLLEKLAEDGNEDVRTSEETTVKEKEDATAKSESSKDIVSRLETLKKLFDEGILTEEEYQKKKDELVSQL